MKQANNEINTINGFLENFEPDKFYLKEKIFKSCSYDLITELIKQKSLVDYGNDGLAYDAVCWLPFTTLKGYPDFWDKEPTLAKFSYFKAPASNTISYKDITLLEVYKALTGGKLKGVTQKYRANPTRDFKKTAFPYVTFSSSVTYRKTDSVKSHSGYICLDFDKLDNLDTVKNQLLNDPEFETCLLFTSPSGNGLKWIIQIELSQGTHSEWFLAIQNYLTITYSITPDGSGKDIVRACFLCHDSEAYINPKLLAYA